MDVTVAETGFGIWEFSFLTTATPEAIFDYLLDFERHGEWEIELTAVPAVRGEQLRPGSRFHMFAAKPQPKRWLGRVANRIPDFVCVITAIERPGHLSWQERYPDPEGNDDVHTCDFYIQSEGNRTRVVRRQQFVRLPKWFANSPLAPTPSWKAEMQTALQKHPARGLRKRLMSAVFGKEMFTALAEGDAAALSPSPWEASEVGAIETMMKRLEQRLNEP